MKTTAGPTVTPNQQNGWAVAATHPVLIDGRWRAARATETFHPSDPTTRRPLPHAYPISAWADIDAALTAATGTAAALRALPDGGARIAAILDGYAAGIDRSIDAMVAAAASETALPVSPRLRDVELPRTIGKLRQAAAAAREGSRLRPTIDTKAGLRSCLAPIGPAWILGPNNFPLAFNGVSGGDFTSAIAASNPVIAKAHPLHPTTSRLLAELAHAAAVDAGLPSGTVQLLYPMTPNDGFRLARDPRLAGIAFTGGRPAGLKVKAAADAPGTPFFGEMSSINPTVVLPAALDEDAEGIAAQLSMSLLHGTGQFCTKPGLILAIGGTATERFIQAAGDRLAAAPNGTLFSEAGELSLSAALRAAGADAVVGDTARAEPGFGVANTLLWVSARRFQNNPHGFQTEVFGNAGVVVVADDAEQLLAALRELEGNLTGTVYSAKSGADDALYDEVADVLRRKVGRLLNDRMPTGVTVSPARHHGGPYPATSQPHFSAVGIPGSILRFTQLEAYDNVRPRRLPPCLQDGNPTGRMWRMIDGNWTQGDVSA